MTAAPPLAARVAETDRRRADRHDVAVEIRIADRSGATIAATIMNISQTGIMAVTARPMFERDPVRIELPVIGWTRGDIVWALGDRIGAHFRSPLDNHLYGAFLKAYALDTAEL